MGGFSTGVTYAGSDTFCDWISKAMSLPHTAVWSAPEGTITLLTPTCFAPEVSTLASVLTMLLLAEVTAPNLVSGQVTTPPAGLSATQWRAGATRFGASSAPEHNAVPALIWMMIPTANVWVLSSVPPWMGWVVITSAGVGLPQVASQGSATARMLTRARQGSSRNRGRGRLATGCLQR